MNVKKFSAPTSREGLRLVREALGDDAVILSNRTVNGGVEIVAVGGADMAALATPTAEKEVLPAPLIAALSAKRTARPAPPQPSPLQSRQSDAAPPLRAASFERLRPQPAPEPIPAPEVERRVAQDPDRASVSSGDIQEVMEEIRSMRSMFESQLAAISWGAQHKREPMKATVLREMLAASFSASLSRYLTENLPEQSGVEPMDWIKGVLMRNLAAAPDENTLLDNGGVFAMVGPTGVGKTTTTAKLAARCVMRHGAGKLALITTDGYRIGGFEQLRIYGKILGVMVHSVKDEADLRIALAELQNKHTILIDTAGAGQRDQMVAEQVAMLSGADTPVKRILCMSATSNGDTLNEVVQAYKGNGLAGVIITKMDEAVTIGSVLDVIIRQKLQLQYIANGQRVPEDLHFARPNVLVDRAFKLKKENASNQFQDSELPLIIGSTAHLMNDPTLREVVLG